MEIIYSENGASHFNLYGLQNTSDDLIVNMVMGTMFVVLPAFWLGALTWAGVRVGGSLGTYLSTGTSDTRSGGALIQQSLSKLLK